MGLHIGKLQEYSQSFSFCLQNSSTTFPKKKIGGDKGGPLLEVRERAVAPLFSHVLGAVLALCFLGNDFVQWGKSITISKEGKIARG